MIKKISTLVFVMLMMSSVFMTPQTTNTSTLDFTPVQEKLIAETDLDRVTWEDNVAPNRDFESWSTPTGPENLITTRTTEEATWIETTVVNEGTQALGMHARALDPLHESAVRLTQQAWIYWDNPINTTLDFDWYLDGIGNPVDQDYFRMQVRMSGRNMYYYIGSQATVFNTTSTAYFIVDGPTQVWNHLHRNLTSDYIDVFGLEPLQFQLIYWWIRSYTDEYTRVYMDDVNLVNSSYVHVGGSVLNGDFEGIGGWTYQSNTDPADISQSSESYAGNWSMNMTAISYNYSARATAQWSPGKRLSEMNQGQLSFYWQIDEWINSATNTLAYVRVNVANTTTSLTMYYYLCVGGAGTLPPVIFGDDMKFQADSFNVTGTWNFFDRNIWEDFHTFSTTEDLWIESITFSVSANNEASRLSLLIDEMSFVASIMNDMSYETQGGVGTLIHGWFDPETSEDAFTVTDETGSGFKAANLTLLDGDDFSYAQELGHIKFDETTELIFDFNVYLDTFNETSEDFIFFEFGFGDGETLTYVVANSSSEFENWIAEEANFIILQDVIGPLNWLNFQLDLVHDYETVVGLLPDTTLNSISLTSFASMNSRLTVLLDDLYIYYDPAPSMDVGHSPIPTEAGGFVLITATVTDATLVSAVANYSENSGPGTILAMNQLSETSFQWNMTDLSYNVDYDYYVTITDAFGKSATVHGWFSLGPGPTTTSPPAPTDFSLLLIAAVGVIAVIGVVIVWYMYVYKKK
ncbi:MAG: hypothetical protein ACXABY_09070 [Candidatus Thorarchaeota archaeon]|jgi:hypothetical protein